MNTNILHLEDTCSTVAQCGLLIIVMNMDLIQITSVALRQQVKYALFIVCALNKSWLSMYLIYYQKGFHNCIKLWYLWNEERNAWRYRKANVRLSSWTWYFKKNTITSKKKFHNTKFSTNFMLWQGPETLRKIRFLMLFNTSFKEE